MRKVKYIILGAGPTGLAIAHTLLDFGVPRNEIAVLEKEKISGGLCRSVEVDGAPLDIGGGHFLDIRQKQVLDFVFKFMPEHEWKKYLRVAKILLRGRYIDHPLEGNLWQMAVEDQIDYIESIVKAGSVGGEPMPESFEEWVCWKLGRKIAEDYMLPYNRKIWSTNLEKLGTYWLYKLPNVSFRETLQSCLEGKACGSLPAHGTFLYPKEYGYGEVWRRMGVALGDCLIVGTPIVKIEIEKRIINDCIQAETIISTIPWTLWPKVSVVPDHIRMRINELMHIAIDVDYLPKNLETNAHWIYEPKEDISYHRMLLRHNFCSNSRGYWTETNSKRSGPVKGFRHRNDYAYPVNTKNKPESIRAIMEWAKNYNIIGAGRWGTWEHMNSDVAVLEGIKLAKRLLQ